MSGKQILVSIKGVNPAHELMCYIEPNDVGDFYFSSPLADVPEGFVPAQLTVQSAKPGQVMIT